MGYAIMPHVTLALCPHGVDLTCIYFIRGFLPRIIMQLIKTPVLLFGNWKSFSPLKVSIVLLGLQSDILFFVFCWFLLFSVPLYFLTTFCGLLKKKRLRILFWFTYSIFNITLHSFLSDCFRYLYIYIHMYVYICTHTYIYTVCFIHVYICN